MKKFFLTSVLLTISFATLSQSYADFSTDEYKKYIAEQLATSIQNDKKLNDECLDDMNKKDLSKEAIDELSNLNLTEHQLASVLGFFVIKAQLQCIGDSPSIVLGYLNEARALNIKDTTDIFKVMNGILLDQKMLARYQYYFLKLPADIQQKINSIEELKQPFNAQVLSKIKTSN